MADPFLDDAPRPWRRYAVGAGAVVLTVLLVVGVVGIFAVGQHQDASRRARDRTTSQQLAQRLLGPSDLPPGWMLFGATNDAASGSDGFGGSSSIVPGCLSTAVDRGRTGEAEEQLIDGPSAPPALNEAVATFPTPAAAAGAFAGVQRELGQCRRLIVSPAGGSQASSSGSGGPGSAGQATVNAASIPSLGDQSAGWVISVPVRGQTEGVAVVAVRRGSTITLVAYGVAGSPDLAQAVTFSRLALTKLG